MESTIIDSVCVLMIDCVTKNNYCTYGIFQFTPHTMYYVCDSYDHLFSMCDYTPIKIFNIFIEHSFLDLILSEIWGLLLDRLTQEEFKNSIGQQQFLLTQLIPVKYMGFYLVHKIDLPMTSTFIEKLLYIIRQNTLHLNILGFFLTFLFILVCIGGLMQW